MSLDWQDIQQNNTIRIYPIQQLTDYDKRLIHAFYSAIIGPVATAIYLYCCDQHHLFENQTLSHGVFCQRLNMGLQEFYTARKRLEGIGLLQTYRKQEGELVSFVYTLNAPMSAQDFLADPILCGLLVDIVGEVAYQQLIAQFTVNPADLSDYHNITHTFYQVYGKQLGVYSQDVGGVMPRLTSHPIYETEAKFDWAFFVSLMEQTYVGERVLTQEVRSHIEQLVSLYPITVLDMREMVLRSYDVQYHTINIDNLYSNVRENSHVVKSVFEPTENQLEEKGYSKEFAQFIQLCETKKTSEFIQLIKESKNKSNGTQQQFIVEPFELKLLERFVVTQKIPMSVVNVLIHHMLVSENMPSLIEKYAVNTINDWIAHHVTNALEAVEYIKKRVINQEEKKDKQQSRQFGSKAIKRVSLSQQEKEALNGTNTPLSEEERQELLKGL